MNTQNLFNLLQTDLATGLSAAQAAQRLRQNGQNKITLPQSTWQIWLARQRKDKYLWLLLFSMLVSIATYFQGSEDKDLWLNVLFVLPISLGIDAYYTFQAVRWIKKQAEQAETSYEVLRGGQIIKLFGYELVKGDVLYVAQGQTLPADLYLVEAHNLAVNEAVWTGSPKSIEIKINSLVNLSNLQPTDLQVFRKGCKVVRGRAKGVVQATGNDTETGQVLQALLQLPKQTGILQTTINQLAVYLFAIASFFTVFFYALYWIEVKQGIEVGLELSKEGEILQLFNLLVLKGLYLQIKVSQAIAIHRLRRKQLIVQAFDRAETLGYVNRLLLDKTGTLTEGQMKIDGYLFANQEFTVLDNSVVSNLIHNDKQNNSVVSNLIHGQNFTLKDFLLAGYYAADIKLEKNNKEIAFTEDWVSSMATAWQQTNIAQKNPTAATSLPTIIGDPFDSAFGRLLVDNEIDNGQLPYEQVALFPFDNAHKTSLAVLQPRHQQPDGLAEGLVVIKGSSSQLLNALCSHYQDQDQILPLDKQKRSEIDQKIQVQRNLTGASIVSIAYKRIKLRKVYTRENLENQQDFIYAGFVRIYEPLQEGINTVLQTVQNYQIKICVLTGDSAEAAQAILQNQDLKQHLAAIKLAANTTNLVCTAKDFASKKEQEKIGFLSQEFSMIAGCTAEDKQQVVDFLQTQQETIAMIGDGNNDARAMQQALIGVATTQQYNEVLWKTAALLTLNKKIAGISQAIAQGRLIFYNFQKLLAANFPLSMVAILLFLIGNLQFSFFYQPCDCLEAPTLTLLDKFKVFLSCSVEIGINKHYFAVLFFVKTLPIIMLAYDDTQNSVASPNFRYASLLTPKLFWDSLLTSLVFTSLLVFVFFWAWSAESTPADWLMTNPHLLKSFIVYHKKTVGISSTFFVYLTICFLQVINILSVRSPHSLFAASTLLNKKLWYSFLPMFLWAIYLWFAFYNPLLTYYQISITFHTWFAPVVAAALFLLFVEGRKKW